MIQSQIAVNQLVNRCLKTVIALTTLLVSGGITATASAITAENAPSGSYVYQVSRQGDAIGEQRITFEHQGDNLIVTSDSKIDVKVLGMSLYGFDQHTEETWSKDQLIAVSSTADDDGTSKKVEMTVQGNQLTGQFNGKSRSAPLGIFPNSFWNEDTVKQTQILDTSRGKVRKVTISDKGKDSLTLPYGVVSAHHYSIDGDLKRELWYDDKGVLVAGELTARDGSTIRQELLRAP
jgi:hypothetical protein